MRRHPAVLLALALCLAGQGRAWADTRAIEGSSLALTLTGDDQTTIETDPGLTHGIRVVADAVDCLGGPGGGGPAGGEISLATAACGSDMGRLTIMVPPSFPVTINSMGSGNVAVGELLGPLHVALNSDGDLTVRRAGTLTLAVRGSGDATVRAVAGSADVEIDGSGTVKLFRIDGSLKVGQHGSGDLAIAQIEAGSADFDMASSGDTVVAGGHIGALNVRTMGSGDFAMLAGTVGVANLEAAGGGDIRVPHVDGPVSRHAFGGSSILVGERNGLGSAAMRRLSDSVASAEIDGNDHGLHISLGDHSSGVGHFVAGIVVLGLLIVGWRTIRRNGGTATLTRRFAPSVPPAAPRDPGVVALCDLLASLERRLARVEMHVTSREFELNRKFRDIDAGTGGRG